MAAEAAVVLGGLDLVLLRFCWALWNLYDFHPGTLGDCVIAARKVPPALWLASAKQATDLGAARKDLEELRGLVAEQRRRLRKARGCTASALLSWSMAAGGAGAAVWAVRQSRAPFRDHVALQRSPQHVRRTVTIQCPGVLRDDVFIKVPAHMNGAEVKITRHAARGLTAAVWSKTYSFPWHEGSYECKQEEIQLEHGVLTLHFDACIQQERIVRLSPAAPVMVCSMAGGSAATASLRDSWGNTVSDGCHSAPGRMQDQD